LLYDLFRAWAGSYHQKYQNITITTAPTGSGKGIAAASAGTANIGASDAFLSSGNLVQDPDLLNIPLAISAQQVNYYLPKLSPNVHLRLNATVLAEMYEGKIRNWNAGAIQNLNKGVSLPSTPVVPLHRSESSGDTFLFSSYLSTDPGWNSTYGYGTTVAWPPASVAPTEPGNGGMVAKCSTTPGCVAYIGISYLTQALQANLGEAELQNSSGGFSLPEPLNMRDAVARFVGVTPANETISMVNGPAPLGYPIVNFEYAIVAADQPNPAVARAIKAFLHWVITTGNSAQFLGPARFQPLPAPIVKLADAQIGEIR
jgi:phosphate transport system substrate-binding protein